MIPTLASSTLAWLLTYAVHSTVLLGVAWLVLRLRRPDPATAEVLWKVALVGGLVTASLQGALDLSPAGSVALERAPAATTFIDGGAPIDPDALVTPQGGAPAALDPAAGSTQSAATSTPLRLPPLAVMMAGAWLVLALAMVLWYASRRLILVGRLGDRRTVVDGPLPAQLAQLCREAGVTRRITLTSSTAISSPVALGRSEICLPAAVELELDPDQQRAMLAHELAHLVRRDPEWLAFACLMERAFFFQPLNRLARSRMQQAAEYQADAWAASRCGGVPLARCLVKVAEWIQASPLGVPVAGMAEERSQLASRVTRLLETSGFVSPEPRRAVAFLSAGAVVAMVLFAPGVMGRAVEALDPATTALENDAIPQGTDLLQAPNDNAANDKGDKGSRGSTDEPNADPIPEPDPLVHDEFTFDREAKGTVAKADTAVVRALIARLRDEDAEVRQAAAHALGRIGNGLAIQPLVVALDDDEPEVQRAALDALSQFERGVPAAPIRRMLEHADAEVRHTALHVLSNLRDRASLSAIAALVRDSDADVRENALQALAEIGDPSSAGAIVGALDDQDPDVREAALQALSEVGGTISEAAMLKALRDADADVRDAAIHLVEERRMAGMVPELVRMLDDGSSEVRECAAEALTQFRTEQSHAALKAALTHRDAAVRRIAVEYFGEESDS